MRAAYKDREAALLGCLTVTGGRALRPGCRVLKLGGTDGALAMGLANALPDCTVILLDPGGHARNLLLEKYSGAQPGNLELLSCDVESANFLPGSMAAVVAAAGYGCEPGLVRTMARWLEPDGRLILIDTRTRRRRWLEALGVGRPSIGSLPRRWEELIAEPLGRRDLAVFRKRP